MSSGIPAQPQSTPKMIPLFPPRWAQVYGEDRCGIFAEFTLDKVNFVWRWIPPGKFQMGSPDSETGRNSDEGPVHTVTISRGFWLTETQITQAQWFAVTGETPSRYKGDQRPVEQVSWHASMAFAETLNSKVPELKASLPTEAEWEYACRAGTRGAFHIDGSQFAESIRRDPVLDQLGWFHGNSNETQNVKQKAANAWGLFDMHGNVWEWCRDGKRTYTARMERDPQGTLDEGANRVNRGGSFDEPAQFCGAACRRHGRPGLSLADFLWDDHGLRLFTGQAASFAER